MGTSFANHQRSPYLATTMVNPTLPESAERPPLFGSLRDKAGNRFGRMGFYF